MNTLQLDTPNWDLVIDANKNIGMLTDATGSLAQDAASAIKTFNGELFFDTTVGVPYLSQILGKAPSLTLLKQQYVLAALTVPDVASAVCFFDALTDRLLTGQVQVRAAKTGLTTAASFSTINPIGV